LADRRGKKTQCSGRAGGGYESASLAGIFIPAWVMKRTKHRYGAELSARNAFLKQRTLIFIAEVIKRYQNEPSVAIGSGE